jgi:soluble lytic murein transglycosylase-like protein
MASGYFRNLFYKYLPWPSRPEKAETMGTEADTLVTQYPDRASQLTGPVYDYLKPMRPYSSLPQNLYMAVFYPAARKWPPNQKFPSKVQKQNPGIVTVQDYVDKVEAASNRARPVLSPVEENALADIASKLGVASDTLYKLINFESGWNPEARNPYSGARGLIQFMPSTARGMGFVKGLGAFTLLLIGAGIYFMGKRYGYF